MDDDNLIHIACPNCHKRIKVKAEFVGKRVRCPNDACKQSFEVINPDAIVLKPKPIDGGYEVFVSYSNKDKTYANAVCASLESQQIKCWIAPRDVTPGLEWGAAIIEGIDACKIMVLVFSASANDSPQVRREVERAINKGLTLVPLRIEDIKPVGAMEYALSNTHWFDAYNLPREQQMQRLADVVQTLRGEAPKGRPPVVDAPSAKKSSWMIKLLVGGVGLILRTLRLVKFVLMLLGRAVKARPTEGEETSSGKLRLIKKLIAGVAALCLIAPTVYFSYQFYSGRASQQVTLAFAEDFTTVKEGLLPQGWEGDEAIRVRRGMDKPHLAVADKGGRRVTLPEINIGGDFFVEFEVSVVSDEMFECVLLGQSGRDFTISYKGYGGYSGYGASLQGLTMPGVEPTQTNSVSDPMHRIRLERERDIYRLSVNGEVVFARRLVGFAEFKRIALTLPGGENPPTKFYSIRIGPFSGEAPRTRQSSHDMPVAKLTTGLSEDFRNVVEGDLPSGWDADDAVAVRKGASLTPGLELALTQSMTIQPPPIKLHGNFFVEHEAQLISGGKMEVKLIGENGPDFIYSMIGYGGHTGYGASLTQVSIPEVEPVDTQSVGADPRFRVRLERDGEVFRLLVNNEVLHASRLSKFKQFSGLQLVVPGGGPPSTRLFSLKVGVLQNKG